MTGFEARPVRGHFSWLKIRSLYQRAFPASERKPFSIIVSMWKKKKTDVWRYDHNGRFAGFAATINGSGLVLIDYLAVEGSLRGQGIGSMILEDLAGRYPGSTLFVEIESPFEDVPNRAERVRRKAFYQRCGYQPSRTMAEVFGVNMELLCRGGRVDFDTYHRFYCEEYNPWAGERIRYVPYPEDCQNSDLEV